MPDKQGVYGQQVQLLVQVLPIVFKEICFAFREKGDATTAVPLTNKKEA